MRKLLALMMAAVLALGVFGGLTGALAEVKNPGLDVVVVIDFSFSTFPGLGNNPADPEMMCLDAATMLINMCDATFSKAAIVPFTDGQRFIDDYNVSHGGLWKTWIDVSDPVRRRALCDSLYVDDMYYSSSANIHNGNTNYALGMQQALDLMSRSDTGNQKLVLVLGDGISKPASPENEQLATDCARQIEAFGGRIYCMQFGNDPNGQNLLRSIATSSETYWSGVQPSELKDRFSGVFAELIGTEQETITAQAGDGDDIVFDIRIPHKAITEVNVVLDKNKIEGGASVLDNNGQEIGDGPKLIKYTNDHVNGSGRVPSHAYEDYDFVSLKIIQPDAGTWKVNARRAAGVSPDEQMTIDLLYNYQIELMAGLTGADDNAFLKNEHVTIQSWFVDAAGNPSSDDSLYEGRKEDGTGIEAMLTIYDANNTPVLETPMTADYDNHRFVYDIDLNTASFVNKNAAGEQAFHYAVSASGDHLFRETENNENNVFVVFGADPVAMVDAPQFLGTIRINDIFDDNAPDYLLSEPLSNYFADGDGDPLTYVVGAQEGLEGRIGDDGLTLGVRRVSDDNLKEGYVEVYAQDGAGNQSKPVRFTANVISVAGLLDDCLEISANPDQPEIDELGTELEAGQLGKGGSATVQVTYDLVPPSADFPYSELTALELREKLDGVLAFEHETVEKPKDAEVNVDESTGLSYTVSAKRNTGKVQVDSFYSINGGERRELGSNTFEVVNVPPRLADNLEGLLTEMGAEAGESGMTFTVDKDNPELAKLTHKLSDWFADADGAFDSLSFTVSAENLEEEKDIFTPARTILRTFGLIAKEGPVVETNADADNALEGDTLNVTAARFGKAHVTVTATDEDTASETYAIDFTVDSSRDRLMCIITYAVILLILAIIAAVLINKYVVHRPWPRHNDEYRVIQNDFAVLSDEGKESRRFGRTRRKPCTLKVLADHFTIMDDGSGSEVFSKIQLWPTTGNRLVTELKKNARLPGGASVKVDGKDISRGHKAKWCRNGRITVTYRDTAGNENIVVFKRD